MSYLSRAVKEDLLDLARDLGIEVDPTMYKRKIMELIKADEGYNEEEVRGMLEVVQREREREREQLEREKREEKERLEREKREERAYDLERLRLTNSGDSSVSGPSPNSGAKSARDLHHLMQKYNPEKSDIALYLVLFERQARRANIEESDFVHHLAALLPTDIVEILSRESEEKWGDYPYIKGLLLRRFRLNPEAFRTKFMQHQRRPGSLWEDYAYELRSYLEEWLKGVEVTTFEALQDLMLADQIKRRVNAEVREHFIDDWGRLVASEELVAKLDEYEVVRRAPRKIPSVGNFRERGFEANKSTPYKKESYRAPMGRKSSEHEARTELEKTQEEVRRTNLFEKRRLPRCYICNSPDHLRPQCPELNKGHVSGNTENLNNLNVLGESDELLAPFLSTARVCGKPMAVLRDTGATVDVISRNHVDPSRFSGQKVWVRQPLDLHSTGLPLANIEIEGDEFGKIVAKAAVVDANLDKGYYLMGNRTAELVEKAVKKTHSQVSTGICGDRRKTRPVSTGPTYSPFQPPKIGRKDKGADCLVVQKHANSVYRSVAPEIVGVGIGKKGNGADGLCVQEQTNSESSSVAPKIVGVRIREERIEGSPGSYGTPDKTKGRGDEPKTTAKNQEGEEAVCREASLARETDRPSHNRVGEKGQEKRGVSTQLRIFPPPSSAESLLRGESGADVITGPRENPPIVPVSDGEATKGGAFQAAGEGNFGEKLVLRLSTGDETGECSDFRLSEDRMERGSERTPLRLPVGLKERGEAFGQGSAESLGIEVSQRSSFPQQPTPVEGTLRQPLLGLGVESISDGKNLRTPEESQPVTEYVLTLINGKNGDQELRVRRFEGLPEKNRIWYDKRAVKLKIEREVEYPNIGNVLDGCTINQIDNVMSKIWGLFQTNPGLLARMKTTDSLNWVDKAE